MAEPRFEKLQHVGDFLVADYFAFTNINPRNGRIMADWQHWYEVRCRCGSYEYRNQQELRDARRVRSCGTCRSAYARSNAE